MKSLRILAIFLFIFFVSSPSQAKVKLETVPEILSEQNLDSEYNKVRQTYDQIKDEAGPGLIKKFRKSKGAKHQRLTRNQSQIKKRYLEAKKQYKAIQPVFGLKDALYKMYLETHKNSSFDHQDVEREAARIAISITNEIYRLRVRYRSIFIPIVHNMMIDIGVRDRGACKHWAEDLLNHMRTIPRKYFYGAWGEANVEKMSEHNVAVIIPNDKNFETGLVVDPWRTSGKPYWVPVTKDSHYHWSQWPDFGEIR